MKRIATIQDLSCVGKCSLAAAIPVISAAGVECCGIPTALLSNHTGCSSFYIRDLTDELEQIAAQLIKLGVSFDAVYTGYIANSGQMDIISGLIDRLRGEDALIFIDPVMGDNGRLYPAITPDYAEKMRRLCAKADIVVPNLTEAYLLTGREYDPSPSPDDIRELLRGLVALGPSRAVITGAFGKPGETGAMGYDGSCFCGEFTPREDLSCSGTGDLFASALLGALMRGQDFAAAVSTAVRFTYEAVRRTIGDPSRRDYGVNFEQALPLYIKLLDGDGNG